MNRFLRWTLLSCLIAMPAAALEGSFPAGSEGAVTLDWKKFDEMWREMKKMREQLDDLQKPENQPPMPFTLRKAAYKGVIQNKRVVMQGLYEVVVFEPKAWVKVPFLPATVAIEQALLDGQPAGIASENGFHTLVVRGAGRHQLEVRLSMKAPKAEEAPALHFDIPSTPLTVFSLELPLKNMDVVVEPAQSVETHTTANGHTIVTASIPPSTGIDVRWQKAVPEDRAEPTKLYLQTETLMTLSEASAQAQWRLHYTILHRGLREARLLVPEGWSVTSVAGEGLQEWKIADSGQGPTLVADLAFAKKGDWQLVVTAERSLQEAQSVVEVPRLRPVGVEREQGTIGIEAKGTVELQVAESKGLNPIDPQELPPALWSLASQPILYAFRYTQPHTLAMNVTRREEVAVLTTTIDDANAVTVMTPRGQTITRVTYQVRNHLKQYLTLRLPKDAELWSAFVAGAPVKPTLVEKDVYRIPLAKSQINDGRQGFALEIVYHQAKKGFGIAGMRSERFPVPDAPMSRLFWSLYLPENQRFVHFGGDLEAARSARPWNAVAFAPISKLKNAGKKEDRRQREQINELEARLSVAGAAAPQAAEKQLQAFDDFSNKKAAAFSTGVFPVAFSVPESGQLFHFGQVMIVGQSPKLSMTFVHANVIRGVMLLLLGALIPLTVRFRGVIVTRIQRLTDFAHALSARFAPRS
jgi:hypothetical protein